MIRSHEKRQAARLIAVTACRFLSTSVQTPPLRKKKKQFFLREGGGCTLAIFRLTIGNNIADIIVVFMIFGSAQKHKA